MTWLNKDSEIRDLSDHKELSSSGKIQGVMNKRTVSDKIKDTAHLHVPNSKREDLFNTRRLRLFYPQVLLWALLAHLKLELPCPGKDLSLLWS